MEREKLGETDSVVPWLPRHTASEIGRLVCPRTTRQEKSRRKRLGRGGTSSVDSPMLPRRLDNVFSHCLAQPHLLDRG